MPEIIIVDTTLRDGEQVPGFAFASALKIRLASMMDEAGVDQIEAGVPAMGENEKATIRSIRERLKRYAHFFRTAKIVNKPRKCSAGVRCVLSSYRNMHIA